MFKPQAAHNAARPTTEIQTKVTPKLVAEDAAAREPVERRIEVETSEVARVTGGLLVRVMLGGAKVVEKTYKVSCEEGERRLEDETYEEEVATVVVVLLWKK